MTNAQKIRTAKIEYAKSLREQGFTNAEIAKKVGWSYYTTLAHIGKQPKALTSASMKKVNMRRNNEQQLRTLPQLVGKLLLEIEGMKQKMQADSASIMRIEKRLNNDKKKLYVLTEINKDDEAA